MSQTINQEIRQIKIGAVVILFDNNGNPHAFRVTDATPDPDKDRYTIDLTRICPHRCISSFKRFCDKTLDDVYYLDVLDEPEKVNLTDL